MRFNKLVQKLEKGGWKLKRTWKSSLRIFVRNGGEEFTANFRPEW